jgi:hypothetical protein
VIACATLAMPAFGYSFHVRVTDGRTSMRAKPDANWPEEQLERAAKSRVLSFERVEGGTLLRDVITFEPPFGWVGRALAPLIIMPRLRKLFAYRHEVTRAWCQNAAAPASRHGDVARGR